MEKAQGKRTDLLEQSEEVKDVPTLSDMGISWDQSSKWQQLANVPEEEFENAINVNGSIPSARG